MAERHPIWFDPEDFSREVVFFSLRLMGFLPPGHRIPGGEEFKEAVRVVGRAVFTIQVIIRRKLRSIFIESMILFGLWPNYNSRIDIVRFMSQDYFQNDIFNTIYTLFAVIAELVMTLTEMGLPIPAGLYFNPWGGVYEQVLRDDLLSNGGIEELVAVARRRYDDSNLYWETLASFAMNDPIPFAEPPEINNWPANPIAFLTALFDEIPQSSQLAMAVLQLLYGEQGIFPLADDSDDE